MTIWTWTSCANGCSIGSSLRESVQSDLDVAVAAGDSPSFVVISTKTVSCLRNA